MQNDHHLYCGDEARDSVSGYTGIVVSIHKYLNGCRRISICPQVAADGSFREERTFDEPQMELLRREAWKRPAPPELREVGGDTTIPPRDYSR